MSFESIQEYMKLVNEINHGMEGVIQLRASSSCSPNQEAVLEKMTASYTEAALILDGGFSQGRPQAVTRSVDLNALDDGYRWRKYGQKDIFGAKFPRNYYRCAYKYTHNCAATKQAQRSDEDPRKWRIDYYMKHICIEEPKVPGFD